MFNDRTDAQTLAERHPISIDQQTVVLRVPVDPTLRGLPRTVLSDLDRFLTDYRTRGHGPVTVTAPTGTGRDIDGQQTAAEIRQALYALGLDYSEMLGSSVRSDDRPGTVLVSFSQYVASGPVCGVFDGGLVNNFTNRPPRNFGCADQHNLAAMVSDPKDLVTMQAPSASNGAALAAAVRAAGVVGAGGGGGGGEGAGAAVEAAE